jgi:potassium efflux system protein
LWDTTAVDGSVVSITLAHLVVALPIVFLTWVSARNVPGLVETTLLERLPLDKPARYAITSLASYAIVILGIIFSAQAIGLRWEGIQWLVAALGVGLGFGLQEIFANFVSGLILLFEQPIRVGDVVTIGNTTGSVSKIRMRATIVTNWDRQELIIPNKTLITERLINWTLTDSTNRLEIRIGVAYATDTRVACRLLEEICAQHEHILVDPKPIVTFDGFGDSTLNIVIRCFLSRLDLRLPTIHELHTTINERFKNAGIEIAYPQQDLHIRSLPPQWDNRKEIGNADTSSS